MWIGDFVRCHSVVRLLKARFPGPAGRRPDHDAVRAAARLHAGRAQGHRLRSAAQATGPGANTGRSPRGWPPSTTARVLVMPRTWKSALAPFLAGIPERTGFAGEVRFGLLNDIRFGEKKLPRMIDRCGALALPKGAALPADWPKPELDVPAQEAAEWRAARGLPDDGRPVVAFAPGAVGPSKRWPVAISPSWPGSSPREGFAVWVLGSPAEAPLAAEIVAAAGPAARDLTSPDLRNAILALKCRRAPACRTIPASSMSRPPSARRPSASSARPARGTGRRSIRSPRSSRPRPTCPAGPATSRPAGSFTTAACATSRPPRCCPPCTARLADPPHSARYQRR